MSRLAFAATILLVTGCAPDIQPDAIRAQVLSPEVTTEISAQIAPKIVQEAKIEAQMTAKAEISTFKQQNAANSGDQSAGDRGVNIGTVNLSGSTAAILAAAAVLVVFLIWRSRQKYVKATDVLVKHNFQRGIGKSEARDIQNSAVDAKVEQVLQSRVKAIKPRGGG